MSLHCNKTESLYTPSHYPSCVNSEIPIVLGQDHWSQNKHSCVTPLQSQIIVTGFDLSKLKKLFKSDFQACNFKNNSQADFCELPTGAGLTTRPPQLQSWNYGL